MPSSSSRETAGVQTLPRTPSPPLEGRPSSLPISAAQQQEREWVRGQRNQNLNLHNAIRHLESIFNTATTARQVLQQKIQLSQSYYEFCISVEAMIKTLKEEGAQLEVDDLQAFNEQLQKQQDSMTEVKNCIHTARKCLSQLQQREKKLREEYEALCLHQERVNNMRLEAMLSTPPVRYGDPFDKLVGTAPASTPTRPLQEVIHPDPPTPDSRRQFLSTSDRVLVHLRQARALAGLDTGHMDEEITYRVHQNPIEWGRGGSVIGIDGSLVLGQDIVSTADSTDEDESPPIWDVAGNARDS